MPGLVTRRGPRALAKYHECFNKSVGASSLRCISASSPSYADIESMKQPTLFDVSHLTALVTGGGTGIGLVSVLLFVLDSA